MRTDCLRMKRYTISLIRINKDIKKVERSFVDFVSSDSMHFDIVKYCFPNMPHLFWVAGDEKTKKQIDNHIFKNDKNVYVILN